MVKSWSLDDAKMHSDAIIPTKKECIIEIKWLKSSLYGSSKRKLEN